MRRSTTTDAGVPVAWDETGRGAPVVLVHGLPTSPRLWRWVVPLVDGARCLAVELVGYGDSIPAGRERDLSVAAQATYLLGWLDAIGLERFVLVGHDVGGGVAQVAAVRAPERVAGLVLTNAVGYDAWPVPMVAALRRAGGLVELVPDVIAGPAFTAAILLGHDDAERGRESADEHWRFYAEHGGAAALVRQARALHGADTVAIQQRLVDLDVPARVVWGADDPFLPLRYGQRFAADLRAPLDQVEGANHFVPEDHPAVVAGALNELLADERVADQLAG